MAEGIQDEETKKLQFIRQIKELRPELAVPGYWDSLTANCTQWANEISVGPFWKRAEQELESWRVEYRSNYAGALLRGHEGLPPFVGKGKKRIGGKLYEKWLETETFWDNFFDEQGPKIPKLNDLVRTRVVCQYIDGVEFIGDKLFRLAEEMNYEPSRNKEGRVEGYFAQHLNFKADVLYRFGGGSEKATINVEIQIATSLSTHVWETTHSVYELSRVNKRPPEEWQWNPKDPEFISNQLGHMIHLADGLLVQLRDAPKPLKGVEDEH